MSAATITLGTRSFEVGALPIGTLRRLLPVFNRTLISLEAGVLDDATMTDLVQLLALGVSLPEADLEQIPATLPQMMAAVEMLAEVSGLKEMAESAGKRLGSGVSQASTPGTSSSAASSPPPAGPGSTSSST